MHGGDSRQGGKERSRTPSVDRRRYLRAVGAIGTAGALGGAGTGTATSEAGATPADPDELRVQELGTDSITLAWYHRAGYAGESTAESYEVLVDGEVVQEVAPPDPTPIEWDPVATATLENLDPGTRYDVTVRAIDSVGATATASLTTTTRDPSRIGDYEFESGPSDTAIPTNWADVTTVDAAERVLRIRGGIVPGSSCRFGTVHEVAYYEDADEFNVVFDAPTRGGPPCPPEVRELGYDFRVPLDRSPQAVVVRHRVADWGRRIPVVGPSSDRIVSVESEHGDAYVDSEHELSVSFDERTTPNEVTDGLDGFTLELAVEDPTIAELTGIDSEITDVHAEDVSIADDGSRLRWEAVVDSSSGQLRTLATISVAGNAAGTTPVTAAVDLHTEALERTMRKAELDEPLRVRGSDLSANYDGVFPHERDDQSVTVAWEGYPQAGTEYEVSVDGTTESVLPVGETEMVQPEGEYGEYRAATIDGLDPDAGYRIDVDEVGPDGEKTSVGHGSVRTLGGTAVRDTAFRITEQYRHDAGDWGAMSVSDDRTRVEAAGGMWFGSIPQTLYLEEVTHEADGLLRLAVAATPGGASDAVQTLGFELGVDLERPVDRVVLEYPDRDWERWWDAELGGDYERFELRASEEGIGPGDRTDLSLTLDGFHPDASYRCRVYVEDPSVASFVDASRPAWSNDVAPDHEADFVEIEDRVIESEVDATERIDLGTVTVEGRSPGTTSFGYQVAEQVPEELPRQLGGRYEPRLEVTDGPTGPPAIGEDRPTDPDGDGLYEDVDGDGELDLADVVDLFQHREDDAVENHPEAYDFSGNDEVDLADAVELFQEQ